MLIIGEKEADNQQVSVRRQGEGDIGKMSTEEFADLVKSEFEIIKFNN
jgi:threonyl-tRNA synthetase